MPDDSTHQNKIIDPPGEEKRAGRQFSRRNFLKLAGLASATLGAGGLIEACEPDAGGVVGPPINTGPISGPANTHYDEVPQSPVNPPSTTLVVLTADQAKTVEALVARIYPGNPSDPGARESGVVNYIDKMLAFHSGAVEPAYNKPPAAKAYTGSQPPTPTSPPEAIYVAKDQLPRYGDQSLLNPQETYNAGLLAVDAYAQKLYQKKYADLTEPEQDQILTDMQNDKASGFTDPSAPSFFITLREHTIEAMFSDPGYGGNVNMVGWVQIGYPGAQRAYTEQDIRTEGPVRPPQSLAMMHYFHPGQPVNTNVVVPNAGGSEQNVPNMPGMQP